MAHELRQAGYLKARALTGGLAAWDAAGLPMAHRPDDEETS